MRSQLLPLALATLLLSAFTAALSAKPFSMSLEVDASEISRKLVHARMTFATTPGELAIRYPEWIPGIHAPRGPIENMGGLRIFDEKGERLHWTRDPIDRFRFLVDVPKGNKELTIELDYICSQPSTNSSSVDTYGNTYVGIINWNTLVVYPEEHQHTDIEVSTKLTLPHKWKLGSAIPAEKTDDVWRLAPVTLLELVDSPAIMGEHLRSFDLTTEGFPSCKLLATSESSAALIVPDETLEKFRNLVLESSLLFGGAHFEEYSFLVMCSDEIPNIGLEHLKSSLNGISERALVDEKKLLGWEGSLLPHEFVHSWCGKFRCPDGMHTHDFHTPKDSRLLWVYEGLTQHLGEVLTTRSGIWDIDHLKSTLAHNIRSRRATTGRQWRSLEDTAAAAYQLRGGSKHWSSLRRNQDYYNEGLLFWLEIDAILRTETDNAVTLDDFTQKFLGANYPGGTRLPFSEEEVIETLKSLHDYDWDKLVDERIRKPQEKLTVDFVELLGYKLRYSDERSDSQKYFENTYNYANAHDSLGMNVSSSGKVSSNVVTGMPADLAGIAPGMIIIGVNDRKFSLNRFRDAIADTVMHGEVRFLVEDGDRFRTLTVKYDGGLRYLELVRDESKPDLIEAIYSPRRES
ncbi:hypothetical protein [Pelagicoccus mobilis]|uniref:Uncharacterized protein n=1 Tax=Pelagicoccus mobilis TaxID=415221 RepID=A0A934VT23_9BACT|nr:hypothetical protein [Pelagicoccus mobilis]MBK1879620.1 hypothetical protein [Pelagicoccus mobilis]